MEFPLYMGPLNTSHKFLYRPTYNAEGGAGVKMLSRQRMCRPKYSKVTDLIFISLSNPVVPPVFDTKFKSQKQSLSFVDSDIKNFLIYQGADKSLAQLLRRLLIKFTS